MKTGQMGKMMENSQYATSMRCYFRCRFLFSFPRIFRPVISPCILWNKFLLISFIRSGSIILSNPCCRFKYILKHFIVFSFQFPSVNDTDLANILFHHRYYSWSTRIVCASLLQISHFPPFKNPTLFRQILAKNSALTQILFKHLHFLESILYSTITFPFILFFFECYGYKFSCVYA